MLSVNPKPNILYITPLWTLLKHTLLHWVAWSFIIMNMATVVYFDKYSTSPMCINPIQLINPINP